MRGEGNPGATPECPAHGQFDGPHCPERMGDGSRCGHPGTPQPDDDLYADWHGEAWWEIFGGGSWGGSW